ncbi:uncharacterized protein LOC132628907 [Lycium barbarum]|uniref:uncharacterized protein LOC132628907 n=1 Tax=Lycium barbarum TaxID=112863 RepID=UPI00293E87FC|nr:uncharacterized protein LOC132628907 [Lycium barbarum]
MFQNAARPKALFIMLLHLLRKLLTTDRLNKWDIKVEPKCSLCQSCDETREHLFVQCTYTRVVWNRVLQWVQLQNYYPATWDQHQQWLIKHSGGKSLRAQIFKMLSTKVVHAIWIERNRRIFEKLSKNWEAVTKEIVYVTCVRAPPRFHHFLHSLVF